jgi:hypothetical protein
MSSSSGFEKIDGRSGSYRFTVGILRCRDAWLGGLALSARRMRDEDCGVTAETLGAANS